MKRILLSLSLCLLSLWAVAQTFYVSNRDGILSESTVAYLNNICAQVEQIDEVQIAVVAQRQMDASLSGGAYGDIEGYAQSLFNHLGVGRKGKNTGVLVLLVLETRDIRIQTGGGMEGILPDATCSDIVQNQMIPPMHEGDFDAGITEGVKAIAQRVTTEEAQQELLLSYVPQDSSWIFLLDLYLTFAILLVIYLCWLSYKHFSLEFPTPLNTYRWGKSQMNTVMALVCLFPLPILFYYLWHKRQLSQAYSNLSAADRDYIDQQEALAAAAAKAAAAKAAAQRRHNNHYWGGGFGGGSGGSFGGGGFGGGVSFGGGAGGKF